MSIGQPSGTPRPEEGAEAHVKVMTWQTLRPVMTCLQSAWLEHGLCIVFIDPGECHDMLASAVILPGFTWQQIQVVEHVAELNPLILVVAIVRDATGLQTHRAIANGAGLALNLLIPSQTSLSSLSCSLADVTPSTVVLPLSQSIHAKSGSSVMSPESNLFAGERLHGPVRVAESHSESWFTELDAEARDIVDLLRSDVPVREIADRLYLSERSLYRQLRRIYSSLGVSGRRELALLPTPGTSPSSI